MENYYWLIKQLSCLYQTTHNTCIQNILVQSIRKNLKSILKTGILNDMDFTDINIIKGWKNKIPEGSLHLSQSTPKLLITYILMVFSTL
jgi:hypothetical protein